MGRQRASEYRAKNRTRQTRLRKQRKAKGLRQISVWLDELALKRLKHFQEISGTTQADVISDGLRALYVLERKVKAEVEAKKKTLREHDR